MQIISDLNSLLQRSDCLGKCINFKIASSSFGLGLDCQFYLLGVVSFIFVIYSETARANYQRLGTKSLNSLLQRSDCLRKCINFKIVSLSFRSV